MTVTHHRSLTERDPGLAGLGVFLDPPALRSWLTEHGVDSSRVTATYLRYKPGTSLTAGLSVDGAPAFGYAVTPEAAPKVEKLAHRAPRGAVVAYDRQRRILLARPEADRDLPGLRSVPADAQTLAYKPQRRWVGLPRATSSEPVSVVRCYRTSDVLAAAGRWPGAGTPIRTPGVRSINRRRGRLLIDRLPGTRLTALSGAAEDAAWVRTGRMLAHWHAGAGPAPGPADLPDGQAVVAEVAWLLPEEAERVADLAARIGRAADTDLGWCHGDFSADQVLIDDEGEPALLDWDRSGSAPRSTDLANADAAGAGSDPSAAGRRWEALLAGYTEVRAEPPGLDRARARAHLLRATEPFRWADPHWPARVRDRLDRVEELA